MTVLKFGSANDTTIKSGGILTVSNGGNANKTTVNNGGTLTVSANGGATSTTVNEFGSMGVLGKATSTTIIDFAYMTVSDGGYVTSTTLINSAHMTISFGGYATSTTVNSNAQINISNGGQATSTTVSKGGWLVVGGGSAQETILNGGAMLVSSGATATNVNVNQGAILYLEAGAKATEIRENGGYVTRSNATFLSNTFTGLTLSNESATVHSMTKANNITLNTKGSMTVFSGGTVTNTTVNGGDLNISSGGFASNTTVDKNGYFFIYSGGTATGQMNFADGASVSAYEKAVIDFDISGVSPDNAAVVNDLSQIKGVPTFTLTVRSGLWNGTYNIAGGAAGFDKTITVKSELGSELGTLSIGGETSIYGEKYTLALNGSDLTLAIESTGGENIFPGVLVSGANDVTSGLIAINVNVNDGEILNILSGAVAYDTNVYYQGTLNVSSGGVANDTDINFNGMMNILADGVANNTQVEDTGTLNVSSGGEEYNATVHYQGTLNVSSGGAAYSDIISPGGSFNVFSGGVANSPEVKDNGHMQVFSDGKLTGAMKFSASADIFAFEGAVIDFDISALSPSNAALVSNLSVVQGSPTFTLTVSGMQTDGTYNLAGGVAGFDKSVTVKNILGTDVGTLSIAEGTKKIGDVNYTLALNDSVLTVTLEDIGEKEKVFTGDLTNDTKDIVFGWSAVDVNINENGILNIHPGGEASNIRVNDGELNVSSGGIAHQITENGGFVGIQNGADVTFVPNTFSGLVKTDGAATVHSGTTATDITVDEFCGVEVYSGGVASNTTVKQNGYLSIYEENGVVDGATLKPGGALNLYYGKATGKMCFEPGALVYASIGAVFDFDLTRTTAGADPLVNDFSFIMANPFDYTLTIDSTPGILADGTYNLAEGATGFGKAITVRNLLGDTFGSLKVGSGSPLEINGVNYTLALDGSALTVTIDGGSLITGDLTGVTKAVHNGGSAVDVNINTDGSLTVSSGGVATNTTVNDGGAFYVEDGGKADIVTLNPGGSFILYQSGTATQIKENGGGVWVDDGAELATFVPNTFSDLVLDETYATVHSNTVGFDISINSGGRLVVFDGGNVSGVTVNSGGSLDVFDGGAISSVTINSGASVDLLLSDTKADIVTVNHGGEITISSGGTALHVTENGGYVDFDDDVVVTFLPNSFTGLTLNYMNRTTVHSGTTATEIDIQSGGYLFVSSGGTALHVTENGGGVLIDGDANVTFIDNSLDGFVVEDIYTTVHSGTTMTNAVVAGAGSLDVYSGGIASGTVVFNVFYASHDAIVSDTTVSSGGRVEVSSGATVVDTIVCDNAYMIISSGGTANGIIVSAGGTLHISGGAKVTGKMKFETGNDVYAYKDAIVDFDLTQTTPGTAALVNDLSRIKGSPTYTLTVSNTQEEGTYNLAEGATGFDKTITVVNPLGTILGPLTVADGETDIGGRKFTLALNGSTLTVTITGTITIDTTLPTISNIVASTTAPTNKSVTVTADFTDNVGIATKQYKIGSGAWTDYVDGAVVEENGTVYFKATDTSGNESIEASYTVSNIDKVKPTITDITPSTTEKTDSVTVTAIFADDVNLASSQYKVGLGDWTDYTTGVTVTANTTIYFKATDLAGNDATAQYEVTNIETTEPDTTKPEVSNIKADITTPTNGNVVVTAEFADNVGIATKQYKIGDGAWTDYMDGVTMTDNGTVYFKATDTSGNESNVENFLVSNIDKIPPAKPTASASTEAPTNGSVNVSATFAGDSVKNEYSMDGTNWALYPGLVKFDDNGTVYFRATDEAGNVSDVETYSVTNIDKVPPAKPTASADITEKTTGSVTVTAVFSGDSAKKEYSTDGLIWQDYTAPIVFNANGKAYFRAFDAAGNQSEIGGYDVTNIETTTPDTTKPTVTNIAASTTALTNNNVFVTADFLDNVAVKSKLYKLGSGAWTAYADGVVVTENATVYFKAVDTSDNESDVAEYAVTNIDKVAPTITNITHSPTAPAKSVTVTATFADNIGLATKQYKIGTSGAWTDYVDGVIMTENGTVYFWAVDTAGNESPTVSHTVTNIDTSTPENGPLEPLNNTLLIDKTTVNTNVTEEYGTVLTAPGQEILLDKIDTVDEGGYHNHVGKSTSVLDNNYKLDYAKIVLKHGAKLSFHAEATAAATFTVYSLTQNAKTKKYTLKKLQTLKLTDKDKDGVFTADSSKLLSLSVSGDYYVSMQFTDKKATDAYYNVTLNGGDKGSVFYPLGNNTDDWTDMKTAGWGGAIDDRGTVTAATDLVTGEWVGFGDKTDYKKITLDSAAELDFKFSASGDHSPVKFTIGKLKETVKKSGTTYSLVTIKSATVAANKLSAELNALRLEKGEYYIKVESTNVKKDTGYDVQITRGDFYMDSDDGWNNALLDGKKLNENEAYFFDNKLAGSGAVHFDKAGNDKYSDDYAAFSYGGNPHGGFVGFGDETDFAKLTVTQKSDVTFTLTATNDATLEIIKVTKNGEKYSKKSIQTVKYKAGSAPATSKKPVTLKVKDGVSYYVSIKATNIKKTTVDPQTYYNVSYAIDTKVASALSMPETASVASALTMPDSLSLGRYDTDVLAGTYLDPASDKLFGESGNGLLASL